MAAPKFQSPSLQQSFGTQYYGTSIVSGFIYDVSSSILYTLYPTINYDIFLNVPGSLAQAFATADAQLGGSGRNPNIPYPDTLYTNNVNNQTGNPVYKQCLLAENGAPLLCENGNYLVVY